jgi:hypothetical protein
LEALQQRAEKTEERSKTHCQYWHAAQA